MTIFKNKYVWTGIALLMLFLVQTHAFTPAKTKRRGPSKERVEFTSNRLYHDAAISYDGDILVGNVHITHDGMVLTCDSAVVYQNTNSFLAYGKVNMVQGDTLSLKGDSLYYDGSSEFAQVFHNVVMKHRKMTLKTDTLFYDRLENLGYYNTGGQIIDGKTDLRSLNGEYSTETKKAFFTEDVILINDKKDTLLTDTLHYDTRSKWAHALGPSNILSGKSRIYTTDGVYNTESGVARMYKRPQLFNQQRHLEGDSIRYDKERNLSEAFGNVLYKDPKNNSILTGQYGWYDEAVGAAMCTERALAKDFSNPDDTLYIHGDTLRLYTYNHKTDSAYRVLHGYFHVRAFRSDMQMVCDSLCFNSKDSCLSLYRDPILWSENRQILGEVIHVFNNDSTIDSIFIDQQALLIEQLNDTTLYNQIGGSVMRAFFENKDLRQYHVDGNGRIINYPMEEDSTYLYLNYLESSKFRAFLSDKRLERFVGFPAGQGTLYPITMAPSEKTHLTGFAWFDWIRPRDPDDVFEWRSKGDANKLKAVPRRKAPMQTLNRLAKKAETEVEKHEDEINAEVEKKLDEQGLEVTVETVNNQDSLPTEHAEEHPADVQAND